MFHKGGDGKPRGFGFGGFQLATKKSDPQLGESALSDPSTTPQLPVVNRHGYVGLTTITQNAMDASFGLPRKRPKTEEEYFDDDEEEDKTGNLEYIPAPGSPTLEQRKQSSRVDNISEDSEEDPLDAFMAGLQEQAQKDAQVAKEKELKNAKDLKGIRDDIENEDDEESYYRYIEENPNAGQDKDDSDAEIEYDEDGNPIAPPKSKYIDPLPPIDHSEIKYEEFEKNFYEEHSDVSRQSALEVAELREKLGVKVSGVDPPKPVTSFGHFGFDERLMKAIRKSEYTQPTPIQAQGIPVGLSGRDLIGIAKTGSGKTAAFVWPLLIHIMDQRELGDGEGPIGLILAPTRELSQQIYLEAKKFGKVFNLRVVCCFGGGSKWDQTKALHDGAEIVVATPGRMIDLIKVKATNLHRVTFLVLDEADRMFDIGYGPQVMSICNHVRPDRQTLMFSATFKKKVERLARVAMTDPIRVVQGELGEANEDVTQIVLVMNLGPAKWAWLTAKLVEFMSSGSVLIFVTKKANSEELANNLKARDFNVCLIHGDLDQNERTKVIASFKRKEFPILVATDVAARGLDIPHIKTVINYDVARDINTHTHRIGRTGRAGEKGIAYTLVTDKDKEFAGHLVRNLEGANQAVPKSLMDLAMQSSWFRKSRYKQGKAKKAGGRGLGYKERPGLGAEPNESKTKNYGSSEGFVYSSRPDSVLPALPKLPQKGPQSDRMSAMRAAFQAQYKTQFCASSDTSWMSNLPVEKSPTLEQSASSAQDSGKRKKKSRWDS